MLTGSYTGISDSGTVGYAATPDVNVPAGPLDDSGFSVWSTFGSNTGGIYGSGGFWDMEPTVVIQFGTDPGGNNWRMDGRSLTPREQKSIDTKYDDGLPQSGAMMSRKGLSNCNTSTDPAVADYNVAFADTACFLELILVRYWD